MIKKVFGYRSIKQIYISITKIIKTDSGLQFMLIMPVVGLIYYGFILATGNSIPCLFYKYTGYCCPGCGLTTMVMFIGKADFCGAFNANPAIFVILPFAVLWYATNILSRFVYFMRIRMICQKCKPAIEILLFIYLMMFGVIRNIM